MTQAASRGERWVGEVVIQLVWAACGGSRVSDLSNPEKLVGPFLENMGLLIPIATNNERSTHCPELSRYAVKNNHIVVVKAVGVPVNAIYTSYEHFPELRCIKLHPHGPARVHDARLTRDAEVLSPQDGHP